MIVRSPDLSPRAEAVIVVILRIIFAPFIAVILIAIGLEWAGEQLGRSKRWLVGPDRSWRPWFAWYPVEVADGATRLTVWLERVDRRAWGSGNAWTDYRRRRGAA